jgi:hypothetical protein
MFVDHRLLKIPSYNIEVVSDSTGKPDKRVNHVKIHPVEWDAMLVFAAQKKDPTSRNIDKRHE